jgi:hypothetical protein
VVGEAHDAPFLQHPPGGVLDRLSRRLVDGVEHLVHRPADRLALGPAGELLRNRVHEDDTPADVGRDHGISDADEGHPQPLALPVELPARAPLGRDLPPQVLERAVELHERGQRGLLVHEAEHHDRR